MRIFILLIILAAIILTCCFDGGRHLANWYTQRARSTPRRVAVAPKRPAPRGESLALPPGTEVRLATGQGVPPPTVDLFEDGRIALRYEDAKEGIVDATKRYLHVYRRVHRMSVWGYGGGTDSVVAVKGDLYFFHGRAMSGGGLKRPEGEQYSCYDMAKKRWLWRRRLEYESAKGQGPGSFGSLYPALKYKIEIYVKLPGAPPIRIHRTPFDKDLGRIVIDHTTEITAYKKECSQMEGAEEAPPDENFQKKSR